MNLIGKKKLTGRWYDEEGMKIFDWLMDWSVGLIDIDQVPPILSPYLLHMNVVSVRDAGENWRDLDDIWQVMGA